ncbi:MAG: FKBP-type peptidyl-prolyl cis-trans isomerase [Oscillospiraceae bacterium]|nr:FKBP-type peptidyl-prolyl cis-trans isomerase [Oscillospiraceae bacterium]
MAQQKNTKKKNPNSVTLSRKKIVIIAVAVALVLALLIGSVVYLLVSQGLPWSLTGTGTNDTQQTTRPPLDLDDFDPFAGVDFSNYINVGDWRGVVLDLEAFDDEQMSLMMRAQFAEETDRTVVQLGDHIIFDFDGYAEGLGRLEGMAFEGADLIIGSDMMIPGFEEQVVGQTIGQTFEIHVTFPDEYPQNAELEGRDAVFTCVVHEIFAPPAQLSEEQIFMASEGATTDKQELLDIMFNQIRDMSAMQAFHAVFDQAEFIGSLPAAANIYEHMGPQGESWAQEDLVVFAIAAQAGVAITQADVDEELERFRRIEGEEAIEEAKAQIRQMQGEDLTEEEMLLMMLGTSRAEFVRSLMFARIGELIFSYAVDSEGNSVYVEARETSRS